MVSVIMLNKFWILSENILILSNKKVDKSANEEIEIFTNQAIDKINTALEKFRYNVIIAVFHEIFNFYNKILNDKKNHINLKENFKNILIVMSPVIPHLSNECLEKISNQQQYQWPLVDKKFLDTEEKDIVIQINGKKRGNIIVNKKIEEIELLEKIKKMEIMNKYIKGKKISKTIYVKQRLINIIIK